MKQSDAQQEKDGWYTGEEMLCSAPPSSAAHLANSDWATAVHQTSKKNLNWGHMVPTLKNLSLGKKTFKKIIS